MQISQYLTEAPNEVHLATKVALIFGSLGAMRRLKLAKLKVTDVSDGTNAEGSNYLFVKVKNTKTKVDRSFVIRDQSMHDIGKKYMEARKSIVDNDRFFMRYTQGTCVNQPIGINNFGGMPKMIAEYLQLPNSEIYTGHCFTRTAAKFLVAGRGGILALKRLGAWKSNAVIESYVADSDTSKVQICNQITKGIIINDPNKFGLAARHVTDSVNNSGASNALVQDTRLINPVNASNIGAAQSMNSDSATPSWNQFESVEYEHVCADVSMIQEASFMTGQTEQNPLAHDSTIEVSSVITKQPSPGMTLVNLPQKGESNSSNGICGIGNIDLRALQDNVHPAKSLLEKVPLATESGKQAETTGQNINNCNMTDICESDEN